MKDVLNEVQVGQKLIRNHRPATPHTQFSKMDQDTEILVMSVNEDFIIVNISGKNYRFPKEMFDERYFGTTDK